MIGTVVVAGRAYPIRRLSLRGGMLVITADGPIPAEPAVQEPATVFGEDGQGFAQAWPCDIPGRGQTPCDWVTIELPIRIGKIENE